jgi:hypothetical protein
MQSITWPQNWSVSFKGIFLLNTRLDSRCRCPLLAAPSGADLANKKETPRAPGMAVEVCLCNQESIEGSIEGTDGQKKGPE